jgi:hypothetical protein
MRLLIFQRPSNGLPTPFQRGVPTLPPYPPRPLEGGRGVGSPSTFPRPGSFSHAVAVAVSLLRHVTVDDGPYLTASLSSRGRT